MVTIPSLASERDAATAALIGADPTIATRCDEWTGHEVLAHLVAAMIEMARPLEAVAENKTPPPTETDLEVREAPFRAKSYAELESMWPIVCARFQAALDYFTYTPEMTVTFAGLQWQVPLFAMHARSELALHRWDVVGDDSTSTALLSSPDLTKHAVETMGTLILGVGRDLSGDPLTIAVSTPDQPDVIVNVPGDGTASMRLSSEDHSEFPRLTCRDGAARLLYLWGRRSEKADAFVGNELLGSSERSRLDDVFAGF